MQSPTQSQQVTDALKIAAAIADTIKELGSIPSGHLYAQLMGRMSLETYDRIIAVLTNAKLVRLESSHMLVWIGGGR
jgi:hypothetical protein